MSQVIIDPVLSGYNMAKVNDNLQRLADAINNSLLHKDGTNALTNNLDINGKKLLNIGDMEIGGVSVLTGVKDIQTEYENLVDEVENLLADLQDMLNQTIEQGAVDSLHKNNAQAVFTIDDNIINGGTLTLPVYYTVGKNTLRLSYNNTYQMYRGKDFTEDGEVGERSNTVTIIRSSGLPTNASIEVWVDGEDDMTQLLEAVNDAAVTLAEYPTTLLNNFISSVDAMNAADLDTKVSNANTIASTLATANTTASTNITSLSSLANNTKEMYNQISTWYSAFDSLYHDLLEVESDATLDLTSLNESVASLKEVADTITSNYENIMQAKTDAESAKTSAETAKDEAVSAKEISVSNASLSQKWAEGTDTEVSEIGGTHSSKVWNDNSKIWAEGSDEDVTELGGEHSSKEWANLAKGYKDTAVSSATAASNSEEAASNSATLAGTYAQSAADSAAIAQNITSNLENATAESEQVLEQATVIKDTINTDQNKSRLYAEGSDDELAAYGITDVEHSSKVWNELVQATAADIAGFDPTAYYTKTEVDTKDASYLPLAGGTMSGTLTFTTPTSIKKSGTNSTLELYGDESGWTKGAVFQLKGAGAGGNVYFKANDGTNTSQFVGKPDGTLTWNSNNVLTSGNYSSYALPLSGGTMTGTISIAEGDRDKVMASSTDDSYIKLHGGKGDNNSSQLILSGKDSTVGAITGGSFGLRAINSTSGQKVLLGKPDGTFTWGGSPILTSANANSYVTGVPSGVICMWSGASTNIPSGWYLCDGSNNTPDLRDRFIVGAGNTYSVGGTGGATSASASISGTTEAGGTGDTGAASGNTGATTLTVSQIPSHTHGVRGSQKYAYTSGGTFYTPGSGTGTSSGSTGGSSSHTHTLNSHTHTGPSHTHTFSGSASVSILPPYYALCFIMKG